MENLDIGLLSTLSLYPCKIFKNNNNKVLLHCIQLWCYCLLNPEHQFLNKRDHLVNYTTLLGRWFFFLFFLKYQSLTPIAVLCWYVNVMNLLAPPERTPEHTMASGTHVFLKHSPLYRLMVILEMIPSLIRTDRVFTKFASLSVYFLAYFRPEYRTKWLSLYQRLVRVVSAYAATYGKMPKLF